MRHTDPEHRQDTLMEWMNRLLRGEKPRPPTSARSLLAWDELVALARSRDGRQRQAAVRALSSSSHGPALPVLLERLNDWVDAVRRDARVAVDNFLRDELLDTWIDALPGVAALTRGARADHAETLARIVDWLVEPSRLARLRLAGTPVPRAVERLLSRALMRAQTAAPQRLAAWRDAFRSADIVLAGDAADALRAAAAADADHDVYSRSLLTALARDALESRFSRIRLVGLRVALALAPADGLQMARTMCFDRNANARALAIAALRDDAATMTALVAQAIAGLDESLTARERATALETLCALNGARGLAACHDLLRDPVPAVRATALRRVLADAIAERRDALVAEALADLSSKVRRIAVAQVHRGASPPSLETLASLSRTRPAALASLLAVSVHLPPWDRFTLLLQWVPRFEPATPAADLVGTALVKWSADMRHCYVAPTAGQNDAARHAWAAGRDLLPRSLQELAAFHLRSFGVLAG